MFLSNNYTDYDFKFKLSFYLKLWYNTLTLTIWAVGTVGSALLWHRRGQGFDSPTVHQNFRIICVNNYNKMLFYLHNYRNIDFNQPRHRLAGPKNK